MINTNPSVRVRKDDSIGSIIIDRSDRCNAVCNAMVRMILQGLEDFAQDKSVKLIVITGSGDFFCSGTDLKVLAKQMESKQTNGLPSVEAMNTWHIELQEMSELLEAVIRYPKPVVAAVNGPAMGFGASIVLACHWVLACPEASLSWPETRLGLVPGLSAPLLGSRIGARNAAWWLSSGQEMLCDQAFANGVFGQLCDKDLLWVTAKELSDTLTDHSSGAVANINRFVVDNLEDHLSALLSSGAAATAAARTTIDALEKVGEFAS